MEVATLEEIERRAHVIGLPVALHADGPKQSVDRYYVHSQAELQPQAERALEAARQNEAPGVRVCKYPST